MIICVRTGTKYGIEYVERLRNMVRRYHPNMHIRCLTDQPERADGVEFVDISMWRLPGWWAKMTVFRPDLRDYAPSAIYLDLDTVITGSLKPLLDLKTDFAICANFTRLAGNKDWPCKYGSCVMRFNGAFGYDVLHKFTKNADRYMEQCPKGDQQAIERIWPDADILQDMLPSGYMMGYRDFPAQKPDSLSLAIFAGSHKPHNTPHKWLKEAWK